VTPFSERPAEARANTNQTLLTLFLAENEMTDETPQVAGRSPKPVELEAGKQYAFCTCGRSEKQPFCDGSHKVTSFRPHVFTAEKTGQAWLCMCKHTKNVPFCDGTHKTIDQA
jgi:CDGSH-type Zn-finger protein